MNQYCKGSLLISTEFGESGSRFWCQIVIDEIRGQMTCHECCYLKTYLRWKRQPKYCLPVQDIRGTYWDAGYWGQTWHKEPFLVIVTQQGRIHMPARARGFSELNNYLQQLPVSESPLRWYEHPFAQTILLLLLIFPLGLIIAILIASRLGR